MPVSELFDRVTECMYDCLKVTEKSEKVAKSQKRLYKSYCAALGKN